MENMDLYVKYDNEIYDNQFVLFGSILHSKSSRMPAVKYEKNLKVRTQFMSNDSKHI